MLSKRFEGIHTATIFHPLRILYAYRRDQNLRDYLFRSTLTTLRYSRYFSVALKHG